VIPTTPRVLLVYKPDMPSSVIRYFQHDPESAELLVVFQTGKRYRYHGVPAEVAEGMRLAFSKGEYFNEHIRDRFSFERLDAAE
jgi:hypothetical protein